MEVFLVTCLKGLLIIVMLLPCSITEIRLIHCTRLYPDIDIELFRYRFDLVERI